MSLVLNTDQTTLINDMDELLELAFREGTTTGPTQVLEPIDRYYELEEDLLPKVKGPFLSALAALIKQLNITTPLPLSPFSGNVALYKLTPGGNNGTLSFDNGICVGYIAPT